MSKALWILYVAFYLNLLNRYRILLHSTSPCHAPPIKGCLNLMSLHPLHLGLTNTKVHTSYEHAQHVYNPLLSNKVLHIDDNPRISLDRTASVVVCPPLCSGCPWPVCCWSWLMGHWLPCHTHILRTPWVEFHYTLWSETGIWDLPSSYPHSVFQPNPWHPDLREIVGINEF